MAAFDNTKNHVEINSVPYQIAGYSKSEFSPFIPRLGSGDQTESQFDLLRSRTLQSFEGGQLQRQWDDDTQVFSIQQMYPIFDDGVVYPVAAITAAKELIGATKAKVTAYLSTPQYLWLAWQTASANVVYRFTTGLSGTSISLPSQLSTIETADEITSITQHGTEIWFTGSTGDALGYLSNAADTSVSGVGSSGTRTISRTISFRGSLYGSDGSDGAEWGAKLFRHTGGTGSRARAEVGYIGARNYSAYHKVLNYNNRIFLMRNDGMYAYDGIQLNPIEDARSQIDDRNYRHAQVYRGYLYYWMPDGLYRFNGSLVEKLYDISEVGYPVASCLGGNRLWYAFSNSAATGSYRYDKATGYDYSTGNNVNARLMVFNGKGMYDYGRTETWVQSSPDFTGQGEVNEIFSFNNYIFMLSNTDKIGTGGSGANRYYTVPFNEISANSGNKDIQIITSVLDADFPMIDKNLDNIELVIDGVAPSDQTITCAYRTTGFDGSGSWTTLGTFKTQTELKRYIHKTLPNGVVFRQIQFKFTGSIDVRTGLEKVIVRYTLAPDVKYQWSFTAECYGDKPLAPLLLADDTESTQAVSLLRGNLYNSRMSDTPVTFIDVDQLDLSGDHNDSTTTITLNTTNLLKESGFVRIDDEIIQYTGKTSTTLTGCTRAALGTSAAAHTDNSKVFPAYRVLLEIQNERIELTEPTTDVTENKSRESEITVLLKEV